MKDINMPENLSDKDKEIISSIIEDVEEDFIKVFSDAKKTASSVNILNNMEASDFKEKFSNWSETIGTSYYVSEDVMDNLTDAIASKNLDADVVFIEFKKLKPFKEYNDFLGDLIWRVLKKRDDGVWPETMPPDFQLPSDGGNISKQ